MVETRRSSSASKRPLTDSPSAALPNAKRSKAAEASASSTNDSSASEEVVGAATVKDSEAGSADLSGGGREQPDDVAAAMEDKAVGAAAEDGDKGKSNGLPPNRGRKRQLKSNDDGDAWGRLLSQCSQNSHVMMHSPTFSVGQGRQCDLCVGDPTVSKLLCNLKHVESEGGESVTLLEIIGKNGAVQVNGKVYGKVSTIPLRGGDEIFQLLTNTGELTTSVPPSVSLLESDTGALHIEARTGETSAVAVASTMASLSHLTNELSLIPPSPRNNGDDLQQGSEIPSMPSACKVPDNCIVDLVLKGARRTEAQTALEPRRRA